MSTRDEVLQAIGVAIQAANGAQAKLSEAHGAVAAANQQLVQANQQLETLHNELIHSGINDRAAIVNAARDKLSEAQSQCHAATEQTSVQHGVVGGGHHLANEARSLIESTSGH